MSLPTFRYHPDPLKSGSVIVSADRCRCCHRRRGYLYVGPVYAEQDLDDALCPRCIADGSAHEQFDATFVDTEAFADDVPLSAADEISQRTPGYSAWQSEAWPSCCGDATAYLAPVGANELRVEYREYEASVLSHIIYAMHISSGAATRMLESLNRDQGPTAFLFRCLQCGQHRVHIDRP